jgi:hypothetical protein
MTALTSVHINRTLRTLREEELVCARSRQVEVLDWRGLVAAGEFDPTYLQTAPRARGGAETRA